MPTNSKVMTKWLHKHFSITALIWAFIVELVFNLLLIVFVFSFGVSTGFAAGQPTFGLDQVDTTFGALFGGTTSLLGLIGLLVVIGAILQLVRWLSKSGHHSWVLVVFILGVLAGGYLVWKVIDWSSFGIGFTPILVILGFTAIETIVTGYLVPTTPRPSKGNTNS
jgi:hypothetical protein